jgi:hypothetical protein
MYFNDLTASDKRRQNNKQDCEREILKEEFANLPEVGLTS